MAGIEVKAVDNARDPLPYAYAVKAGPWLFLTGHEAFDFASGTPAEVAGPPGFPLYGLPRSRREGDFILQRMRRILRSSAPTCRTRCGSTSTIRTRKRWPPTTCRGTPSLATTSRRAPRSSWSVLRRRRDDLDLADGRGAGRRPDIRKIHPAGVASAPTSGFVPAVVCNEFVFVAGQMAHNPGQGLDPRAHGRSIRPGPASRSGCRPNT